MVHRSYTSALRYCSDLADNVDMPSNCSLNNHSTITPWHGSTFRITSRCPVTDAICSERASNTKPQHLCGFSVMLNVLCKETDYVDTYCCTHTRVINWSCPWNGSESYIQWCHSLSFQRAYHSIKFFVFGHINHDSTMNILKRKLFQSEHCIAMILATSYSSAFSLPVDRA